MEVFSLVHGGIPMSINVVAGRRAYGAFSSPQISTDPNLIKKAVAQASVQGADSGTPRPANAAVQNTAQQKQSSEAATTVLTQTLQSSTHTQSPQKAESATVRSLLAEGEDDESSLPSRAEVEVNARRYLKVTSGTPGKEPSSEEVKKIADFYGASPDRAARFGKFVEELEQGQESKGENGSVAVA